MESHIATEAEYESIEQAYWDLYTPALMCSPTFNATPDMGQIISGTLTPIVCTHYKKIVGVMCYKKSTGGFYFPLMRGDMGRVLESMILCAMNNFDKIDAYTENELIHEFVKEMEVGQYTRDGWRFLWSK